MNAGALTYGKADNRYSRAAIRHQFNPLIGGRKLVGSRNRRMSLAASLGSVVAAATTLTFFWTVKLTEDCTSLSGVFSNFYYLTGGGNDTPVPFSIVGLGIEVSGDGIQFNGGSYTIPCTFNNGSVGVTFLADRPVWVANDPIQRRFAAGTLLRFRTAVSTTNAANLIPCLAGGTLATKTYDGYVAGDASTGTGVAGQTLGNCSPYGPALVIGDRLTNTKAAIGIGGTSIENGSGDASIIGGWPSRSLMLGVTPTSQHDCLYSFYLGAQPGSTMFQSWLGNTNYARMVPYLACDAMFMAGGINDLTAGRTAAQVQADAIHLVNSMPWIPWIWGAMFPHAGSSNNWVDGAGQTPAAGDADRAATNDSWRGGSLQAACPHVLQIVDCGKFNEINAGGILTQDGGRWLPGTVYTVDGLGIHPNGTGSQNAANLVNVSLLAAGFQGS